MTTRKKSAGGKQKTRKLKLRRETLRDLDARGKARNVKGGVQDLTIELCPLTYKPSCRFSCTCFTQVRTCLNCPGRI